MGIKPTVRMKKRYIAFELIGKDANNINETEIKYAFYKILNQLYGEIGFADLGFRLIEFKPETKKGIVRFRRQKLNKGIACFAFIKNIEKYETRLKPLSTSGSLKKLRERIN
ncbi:Rpp14/Pop5 family protein [Candidatus Micrarchaeota archaeon]|jgi:RNase P/RNase MRP subunit POP5|nr:Rpp14/Pop5 family protein [Candidatus Micrarchaeota archaeon]